MNNYLLSKEADMDLDEIFEFGFAKFGYAQSVTYLLDLHQLFKKIAQNPSIGRERPEIKASLFSIAHKSHVVFYQKLFPRIRIVRVLHGSRDMEEYF